MGGNILLKKTLTIGIMVLLFFSTAMVANAGHSTTSIISSYDGDTLYVGGSGPGNYSKIQDAIDNTSHGDMVFVYDDSSPYYENVLVNKSINLVGENKDTTIIDGSGVGNVVFVSDDWVNITGFTIQNSASDGSGIKINTDYNCFSNNNVLKNLHGFYMTSSSNNKIIGNNVSNNRNGIILANSNNNTVTCNTANSNKYQGIRLWGSGSYNNMVKGNNVSNNKDSGIFLGTSSSNNKIMDNNVSNNKEGIFLSQLCDNNMIIDNIALNNIDVGIALQYSCDSNMIIENDVSNNYCGIVLYQVENNILYRNNLFNSSSSFNAWDNRHTNIWYNSTFQHGNYYDDYTGVDEDGDGIGDIPYDIPVVGNVDRYPLMVPWGENHAPNTPTIDGAVEGKVGETYNYSFISIDQDGNNISYFIDWGDGIEIAIGPYPSGEEATASHSWEERGTYIIRAKAIDIFGAESNWSTLEVTMPRNKPIMNLFESRFPLLYRLLLPFSERFR